MKTIGFSCVPTALSLAPGSTTMNDAAVQPAIVVPAGTVNVAPAFTFTLPSIPYTLVESKVRSSLISLLKRVIVESQLPLSTLLLELLLPLSLLPESLLELQPLKVKAANATILNAIVFTCVIIYSPNLICGSIKSFHYTKISQTLQNHYKIDYSSILPS